MMTMTCFINIVVVYGPVFSVWLQCVTSSSPTPSPPHHFSKQFPWCLREFWLFIVFKK